jgi:hypothetical protein
MDGQLEDRTLLPRTAQQMYVHDHVQRMHNEIESTTRKLELEKRRLNKLEDDVSRLRKEYDEKVVKGEKKSQQVINVRKLESRLAKAISQLNELGHDNRHVRDKIDNIRRDRMQMNQVFKKLQGDIRDNISNLSGLQRDTDQARREQEERQHKMTGLKKQIELERRNFKETVQKLQHELKMREREDLRLQTQKQHDSLNEGKETDTKGTTQRRIRCLQADEEENFKSTAVMRRILKLAFLNAIQRRHIRQHQKNIEVFEQAFATIKSTTGISDIEEIVKIFVGLEQRNFSLLTYVNTLNRDIETFEKLNRDLEDQIKNQKDNEDMDSKQRTEKLQEIEQGIQNTEKAIKEDHLQATQQQDVFDRCKPLVQQIMKTVEKENRGFGGAPAPELGGDNVLAWLTYLEKTLTHWRDFLPDPKQGRHAKNQTKICKYTVGNSVLALPPKKHHNQNVSLVRQGDLPSAANAFMEPGVQSKNVAMLKPDEDSETDEEELANHAWTRQELKDKAVASVAKKKKHKTKEPNTATGQQLQADASHTEEGPGKSMGGAGVDASQGELGYDDLTRQDRDRDDDDSDMSGDSDGDDDAGPTDDEINEIFLKRYKMSKEELQGMADKMGIQLNNLCYLKQEFDAYDEDRSGYIDVKELKGLLEKLGEELSEEELDQAFRELDSDGSGEIEFFEFVEWFTSED